ncbi:hypothetical protein [Streptomyces sp. KR80]|uniref:hypothetical protein n=1 Tax=Streptomyces sp. KR80 TaxID=3457426 RepID=UPI003FD690CB
MTVQQDDYEVGGSYDRGLTTLLWSTAGVSAIVLVMSVIGLAKGNAGWAVVPLLVGCPAATFLVVQGRRQAWMARSIAGMVVLLLSLGATGLLIRLMA